MLKDPGDAGGQPAPPPRTPAPPGRLRRALKGIGAGLGLTAVFVLSAAGGAVLHLDSGPGRRVVRSIANDVLGTTFMGSIHVGEIERISLLDGIDLRDAVIRDPQGKPIISVSGLRVRASALSIARNALLGSGDLHIGLPFVRIENADVLVETAPNGDLNLAKTFEPKPSEKPSKPEAPTAEERNVVFELSRLELGHAWIHGEIAPPNKLDTEVNRLVGAIRSGPEGLSVDIDQTGLVERAMLPFPVAGSANYHLRMTEAGGLADPSDLVEKVEPDGAATPGGQAPADVVAESAEKKLTSRMWADFAGQLGELEVNARFLMEDDRIEATANVPRATPEAIAKLVPGVPLRRPISAKAHVAGHLPRLQIDAAVRIEGGEGEPGAIDVQGELFAGDALRITAVAAAQRIDPRVFGDDLPAATINALADVELEVGDRLRAVAFAQTEPLDIAGQPVPALDVHAAVDGELVSGTLSAHEPGMPLRGSFALIPDGVRFEVSTRADSIRAVPRLAAPVDGSAEVAVSGKVQGGELDASVRASVSGVRAPGEVELGGAQIQGRVHGPFDALALNASVEGQDLHAAGYSFDRLSVQASGPVTSPSVRASFRSGGRDSISVSGVVDAEDAGARNVKLHIEKDGQTIDGSVARVSGKGGRIAIDRLAVRGDAVESLGGSLSIQGGDITGKLHAESVDLERVLKLAGLPARARGVASVDLAIAKTAKGRTGHVSFALENGEASIVSGVSSMVSVSFVENKVTADGFVRLVAKPSEGDPSATCCGGEIAGLRFSGSGDNLRGPLLEPATWTKLAGSVKVAAEDMDLACLARLAPGVLPVSEVLGKVTARLTVAREAGQRLASIKDLSVRSRGLQIAGPRSRETDEPEWESRSIDVSVEGSFDSKTGKTNAALTLFDKDLIADLRAAIDLDPQALLAPPATLMKMLRKAPFSGHFSIPRREIASFTTLPFVTKGSIPVEGEVRVDAYAAGTMEKPAVVVRALGWSVAHADALAASPDASDFRLPVDLDTLITYDSEKATLEAHVSKSRRELLTANAEVLAKIEDLYAGKPKDPSRKLWTGGIEAKLHEAPLGAVPFLARNNVGGHLSGSIALRGINDKPSVAVDLEMPGLRLGPNLFFETARVSVHIDPTKSAAAKEGAVAGAPAPPPGFSSPNTAVAKVELVAQDGGSLGIVGYAGVKWQDGLIPGPDQDAPADVYLNTKKFRIEAFQPFLAGTLNRLDGYLNGDARIGWHRVSDEMNPRMESDLSLTGGVFYVPQLGQEFSDAHVRIITTPAGVIRADDIGAKAVSGGVKGWGLARLKGLKLESAAAELTIGEGEGLPIALEGVPLGGVQGKIMLTAAMRDGKLEASVKVPELHVELPSSIGRSVQPMEPNRDIVIAQPLEPPKEETRDEDALKVGLKVAIDKARIEGPMFKISLATSKTAPINVQMTDKTRISGDILLSNGQLEVLGKRFELDRGLVHLRGEDDPNPYLNVTVRWDAPDGSHIYIDYIGTLDPITDEKIHFRSDPARTKQEIVATLLLGSEYEHGTVAGGGATSQQQGSQRSTGNAAGGLAAGFVADQFGKLFADSGLKTSVGTNDAGALKTGLAYERGSTRTQITYEGAGSSTGTRGSPGGLGLGGGNTEVSIDWRFSRHWLVRGMVRVGEDQPSSGVDLLWQYRY